MDTQEVAMEGNEVIEAPGLFTQLEAAENNVRRRRALVEMLRQRHSAVGKKIIKGMFMRPKRRAGQPATGRGEWRKLARKPKAQPQQKRPKKERR